MSDFELSARMTSEPITTLRDDELPDGGGEDNFPEVWVTIGSPTAGTIVNASASGTTITVSGTAGKVNFGAVTGVWVTIGNGAEVKATTSNSWANWSCSASTTSWGTVTVTARVEGTLAGPSHDSVNITIRELTPPTVSIDALGPVTGPNATIPVPLRGSAADSISGVNYVEWNVDGGAFTRAVQQSAGWSRWSADFNVALGSHPVVVRAFDVAGNPATANITVVANDTIKPTVVIQEPYDGQIVRGTSTGATVTFRGTAQDTQSGVNRVEWKLGTGTPQLAQKTGTDWSSWYANIPIGTFGQQVITITAYDNYSQSVSAQRTITVEAPLPIASWNPDDPLSYLQELLNFAKRRVVVTATNAAVTDFTPAFFQPFATLTADQRDQVVPVIRLVVEVLRRYLATRPPSGTAAVALVAAEAAYRQRAYESLLTRIGTSWEEIRLARTMEPARRAQLAERLGIDLSPTRPDELDNRLFLEPAQLTEGALERLFGLRDTARDPLALTPVSDLLGWQRTRLRRLWKQQDTPAGAPATPPPIVEPDLLVTTDLAAVTGNPATSILSTRQSWVAGQLTTLANDRPAGETPAARFDRLVNVALTPTTVSNLLTIEADRRAGKNIDAQLATVPISQAAFQHLIRLRTLVTNNPLNETEWADLYAILVQVKKVRSYPTWRAQEASANLFLSPDYFRVDSSASAPTLPRWRAEARQRRAWLDTLRARIEQERALTQALDAALAATDSETLPALRDALVTAAGAGITGLDLPNWLTDRLLIDVSDGGVRRTTRVGQAIESLQGLLFGMRSGRFGDMDTRLGQHPALAWRLTDTPAIFDQQWSWMCTLETWRSASMVYLLPENLLLPSLRVGMPATDVKAATPAFAALLSRLRSTRSLTAQQVSTAVKIYLDGDGLPNGTVGVRAAADYPNELRAPFTITEELDSTALVAWRTRSQTLLNQYQSDLPRRRYVEEAFYFVPLLAALQLQEAKQHTQALDWFRIIYAYDQPAGQRKVWYGLVQEESLPNEILRPEQWLLPDELNPHRIAGGRRRNAYTRYTLLTLAQCFLDFADSEFSSDTNEAIARARGLYIDALDLLSQANQWEPPTGVPGMPANPVLRSVRQHAELNLAKIRDGRNIAGMRRQLDPPTYRTDGAAGQPAAAPGTAAMGTAPLQPTPYRYAFIIERAKQTVSIAQQIEAAFLAALEKQDAESYSLLKARQDLDLSNSGIELQRLRVDEAKEGQALAGLQQQRSQIQVDTYQGWIDAGPTALEERVKKNYEEANIARNWLAGMDAAMSFTQALTTASSGGFFGTGLGAGLGAAASVGIVAAGRAVAQVGANNAEKRIQVNTMLASQERRAQEWGFQASLGRQDVAIGVQQGVIASRHLDIVTQEQTIAGLQAANAQATVDFLANKFANRELYAWMSGVLGRVYAYFLQQATSIARLAQNQLAFERQEPPLSLIQADYWRATSESAPTGGGTEPDRLGMTGSARLLQDIYQLDNYAFETDKRKLQLSRTISLARLAPFEFQQFRETGVLPFTTAAEVFDRDFPGHYLRLTKRVRVSIVALIPPSEGIRATLLSTGVSRVTIGGDAFQTVVIRREPEVVALTAPANASGVFELDTQSEMLLPFEGNGVATSWELQLPKPANPFDFRTIADVLFTVDYTALNSFAYRQQVIQRLDRNVSSERAFSMRQEFPDQWYALANPEEPTDPDALTLRFTVIPEDFPPNVEQLRIQHVAVYLLRASGERAELMVTPKHTAGGATATGSAVTSVDGVISTRTTAAVPWGSLLQMPPTGDWELLVRNDQVTRDLFARDRIEDVVVAITFSGQTPAWPA